MTPGPVDLKIVHDRLTMAYDSAAALRRIPKGSRDEFLADPRNPAAADTLLLRASQGLLDTARHLLSTAFGLGTLECKDVARLAKEKGLVTDPDLAGRFLQIAGYRNRMTHLYDEITPEELFGIVRERLSDLESLAHALRKSAGRLAGGKA